MKPSFQILFLVALSFGWLTEVEAQYPKVDIPGSQSRKIYSKIVEQEYELQILLPGSYANSNKKYPVVYLMDSQWDFPLVKSIYGQQYYDGFIPELIIVGVTWGGENPKPDSLRGRDYTPTKENRMPHSGGADRFLSFMKNELFPFIESNYKADPSHRSLMGCSLGGLITLYALFTQPELFNGYAAASPAIGWDREVLSKYEKDFGGKTLSHPVRVYMTIGDVERGRVPYERFANSLMAKNYPMTSIQSKVLENTGHSGTKSETFSRGLQYIFERPQLELSKESLALLGGTYQSSTGTLAEVVVNEKGFYIKIGGNLLNGLFAASETEFYLKSEFNNISFKKENDTITGFEWLRYGNSQFFSRLK